MSSPITTGGPVRTTHVGEQLNNPAFNPIEFDGIRMQAGLTSFTLTAKRWIESTGSVGIVSKAGRYGGTYAHKDIAFEFASWVRFPKPGLGRHSGGVPLALT